MTTGNGKGEVKVLSKIAKALEDLPGPTERRQVIDFLAADPWAEMQARADAARRVATLLGQHDEAARRRILAFFDDQLGDESSEAPAA